MNKTYLSVLALLCVVVSVFARHQEPDHQHNEFETFPTSPIKDNVTTNREKTIEEFDARETLSCLFFKSFAYGVQRAVSELAAAHNDEHLRRVIHELNISDYVRDYCPTLEPNTTSEKNNTEKEKPKAHHSVKHFRRHHVQAQQMRSKSLNATTTPTTNTSSEQQVADKHAKHNDLTIDGVRLEKLLENVENMTRTLLSNVNRNNNQLQLQSVKDKEKNATVVKLEKQIHVEGGKHSDANLNSSAMEEKSRHHVHKHYKQKRRQPNKHNAQDYDEAQGEGAGQPLETNKEIVYKNHKVKRSLNSNKEKKQANKNGRSVIQNKAKGKGKSKQAGKFNKAKSTRH